MYSFTFTTDAETQPDVKIFAALPFTSVETEPKEMALPVGFRRQLPGVKAYLPHSLSHYLGRSAPST
jgi:hypothetical protein